MRSSRSCLFSRRSRASSSRPAAESPLPFSSWRPSCRSACATQWQIDCAVGSNSRASSAGSRPARTKHGKARLPSRLVRVHNMTGLEECAAMPYCETCRIVPPPMPSEGASLSIRPRSAPPQRIQDQMNENHAPVWIVTFVSVLALARISVAVAADCQTASGDFTAVRPQSCSSPVGVCTHGTLKGGFPSTYDFSADTLQPANDPSTPNKSLYTGHSVITTPKHGKLFGHDIGFLFVEEDGRAPFVTTVHVVGGTRQYVGVSGQFVAHGVLDLAQGTTDGTYTAVICNGED
jgi:hypothetical protein